MDRLPDIIKFNVEHHGLECVQSIDEVLPFEIALHLKPTCGGERVQRGPECGV